MDTRPGGIPPHFIVIVPGYMGSLLKSRKTGKIVWIDVPSLIKNPLNIKESLTRLFDSLAYPNDDLEPAGIVNQVVFVPPLFKQEQYGRLVEALQGMGYILNPEETGPNVPVLYTFDYDWRQDNRLSAKKLGEAIDRWRARHPGAKAWLIGHSNGGIVSRWYIEKEGGKNYVERLFLMASPWDGAPKSMQVLLEGLPMAFLRLFSKYNISELTHKAILTFPSYYQLIPYTNPFLHDLNNLPVDLFTDPDWLETEEQRRMLLDGRKFNEELGLKLSVETLCFFGIKKPTTTAGLLRTEAGGRWAGVEWDKTEAGDGTVPERSAVHPNAQQKLPFVVGHGDIYINPAVLEKLKFELAGKYILGVLAEVTTARLRIMFEPEKDVYSPGETIQVWTEVHERDSNNPVFNAEVEVSLVWREGLPGQVSSQEPAFLPSVVLNPNILQPGRYEGNLDAPMTEGYFAVLATVDVPGEPTVILEELVLVEREP